MLALAGEDQGEDAVRKSHFTFDEKSRTGLLFAERLKDHQPASDEQDNDPGILNRTGVLCVCQQADQEERCGRNVSPLLPGKHGDQQERHSQPHEEDSTCFDELEPFR